MTDEQHPPVPASVTQATAPSRPMLDLERRPGSDSDSGADSRLAWGSRSDVGLIRDHNEDSFLCRPPLFAVSDGMGGHAAGEVASSIAIHTIVKEAPSTADSALLGAAIEAANMDVITAPETGRGREGMGCTATACIIEDDHMAVAHVGDSRLYLLHKGSLVRVTHDHSFVEELVDAGEITADEARVHPSRSVITRALGSDPDMYADHFTIGVEAGERVILCSDGLSSMITDAEIEDICVTSASPQVCADALVSAALIAGGHDNVTVIVVDIKNDGKEDLHRRGRRRAIFAWVAVLAAFVALVAVTLSVFINSTFYLAASGETVGIYRGMEGDFMGLPLSHLVEQTDVPVASLPEAVQGRLAEGIPVDSEDKARTTVEDYRRQIQEAADEAQETADTLKGAGDQGGAAA
ncbi:Stp1/IreP family PP2C-type Ser/Thr phosphatase [Atopobiaceae bacterium 24-176]